MSDTLQEIINFFEQYKTVYNSEIHIDGELSAPEIPKKQPVQRRTVTPQIRQRRAFIKQDSPELQAYFEEIKDCQKCALGKTRTNFVFGFGHPQAKVMFIGEAPGQQEDEQGVPFVGPAGLLLDKMLFAIGLKRDDVFIANVLKCRPPQNRDPLPAEVVQCEPYLQKQLDLIKPKVLVSLGRISGQTLLRCNDSLTALRNKIHEYNGIPLLVTYHPSALLRNPRWKRESWIDLKKLRELLEK
jgi:uracil-DNA glycosylase family 4